MSTESSVAELQQLVGHEFAATDWITISQQRIDQFAACTDDHQFIHLDAARAGRESPYGQTVAHGFLSLALIAGHVPRDFPQLSNLALTINYGLDRVRFMAPVRSGARVRLRTRVLAVTPRTQGMLMKTEKTMQIEGESKPAYIAEHLQLFVPRSA